MDEQVLEQIRQADWTRISLRLTLHAAARVKRWRWRTGNHQDLADGLEPGDIACQAIARLLTGQRAWDPERHPDLFEYLKGVVNSLVSNLGMSKDNQSLVFCSISFF